MMATQTSAMKMVQRFRFFFRDTRRAGVLGQATAEHIGQTAALALVHEDEQRQQDGRDDDDDLKNDLQNMHGETSIKRTVS